MANFNLQGTTYRFDSVAGEGGFGVVCKAFDVHDAERASVVAIKKIPMALYCSKPELLKRVYREIRILGWVSESDHIIKILDAFLQPSSISPGTNQDGISLDDVYVVMEYMDTDLYQVLHGRYRQILTLEHIRYLVYQLLLGLDYLHSTKPAVVHRDLKPHNLLLNGNCRLKIADFGLARVLSKQAVSAATNAPPMTVYVVARAYRAPELVFGLPSYSTSIDMWSVGCIVCEMITRQFLFPARTPIELIALMLANFGAPPSGLIQMIPSENIRQYVYGFQQRLTGDAKKYLANLIGHFLPYLGQEDQPLPSENEVVFLVDFLASLLAYDPQVRLSARAGQSHPFIRSQVLVPRKVKLDSHFEEQIASLPFDRIVKGIKDEVKSFHRSHKKRDKKKLGGLVNTLGKDQVESLLSRSGRLQQAAFSMDGGTSASTVLDGVDMNEPSMTQVANDLAAIEKDYMD